MRRWPSQLGLVALILAADRLSKWWIESPGFHDRTVIDGFFNIVRAHNSGVAFSLFADLPAQWRSHLLLGITAGIACMVFLWWLHERGSGGLTGWSLLLVLSGAIGNIWDRLQQGYVVDFLDFYVRWGGREYHWPAFNVADSGITIGVLLLLVTGLRR